MQALGYEPQRRADESLVEHLELWAHACRPHLSGHVPQDRNRCDHCGIPEIHGAHREACKLGTKLKAVAAGRKTKIGREVQEDFGSRPNELRDTTKKSDVGRWRPILLSDVNVRDRRAGLGGLDRRRRDLFGRDGKYGVSDVVHSPPLIAAVTISRSGCRSLRKAELEVSEDPVSGLRHLEHPFRPRTANTFAARSRLHHRPCRAREWRSPRRRSSETRGTRSRCRGRCEAGSCIRSPR